MASQVPYSPIPSVAPTGASTPYRSSEGVSGDAFGGGVASALSNLGRVAEKAGDEIFARANAMQELNQQAEASKATAEYQMRLGEMQASFQTTLGKNSVDGLPVFIKDTEDVRGEVGKSLSSDYARKLFDAETRNTRSRSIFSAAGHAATQNKQYILGASDARIEAAGNSALLNPQDESQFRADLSTVQGEIAQKAAIGGWSPEKEQEETNTAVSKLWVQRIQGMAKEQPFTAGKQLDKAIKEGHIQGEDIGKITDYVNKQRYTVGSRQISQEVNAGAGNTYGSKVIDIKQAQQAISFVETGSLGGNYNALGVEVFGKDGRSRGRALGRYQVMPENLPAWLAESGLPPMTPQEFLKSPDAQDQLFNTIFGRDMKKHGSFNEALSLWFTGDKVAAAQARNATDGKTTINGYLAKANGALAQTSGLPEKVALGKARAAELAPEDPMLADYVEQRIVTDSNRQKTIQRDEEFGNRQTVESGLMGGNEKGSIPTSVEELKAISPETEAAWNAMKPSDQRRYMGVLAKNAKGDTSWTDDKLRDYQRLRGMAQADPAGFLDQDVVEMDLPLSARKELISLQTKLKGQAEGDPRVTRALQILGPDLQAAGINRDKANRDDYFAFVGSLADALEQHQAETKKQPTPEEVKKIGSQLMLKMHGSGWFGTDIGANRMYQLPVPTDLSQKIKDAATAQGLPEPTDAQIQREYTRQQYQKLYAKPAKTSDATPSGPKVPISR